MRRSILGVLLGLACSTSAQAQVVSDQPRHVPGCNAAVCEESAALIAALDTLLRHENPCGGTAPFVLETLHFAPFTAFSDAVVGRQPPHPGLPSSPAVLRVEDLGVDLFGRYWGAVRVVSPAQVAEGAVPAERCLYVFSPVTWLGPDGARIIVARSRQYPVDTAQYFVFLERRENRWVVSKVEAGFRS